MNATKTVEDIDTRWANKCPQCGYIEERHHGPGHRPKPSRCPDCDWPMNTVDPDVIKEEPDDGN